MGETNGGSYIHALNKDHLVKYIMGLLAIVFSMLSGTLVYVVKYNVSRLDTLEAKHAYHMTEFYQTRESINVLLTELNVTTREMNKKVDLILKDHPK